MVKKIKQFDIFWVKLDPTIGSERKKTRPCVVVSPNTLQNNLNTVIVAPLSQTMREYPSRTEILCKNKKSSALLDQIRCIDKSRLVEKIGTCTKDERINISEILVEMFEIE